MHNRPLDHDQRIERARAWVPTCVGKHLLKTYYHRFGIDRMTGIEDLGALGVYDTEELDKMRHQEAVRLAAMKPKAPKQPTQLRKHQKKRCPICGHVMVQCFIGLEHCRCGLTLSKQMGYFERTPDMVFALERKWIGKQQKQASIVRRRGVV